MKTGCPFVAEGKVCPMDLNPFRRRVFNHIPRVGRLGGLESVYVDSFSRHEHLGLERLVGVFAKLAGIKEVGMREVQLAKSEAFPCFLNASKLHQMKNTRSSSGRRDSSGRGRRDLGGRGRVGRDARRMNTSSSTSSGSELEAGSFFSRSSGSVGSRSPQLSPWSSRSRLDSEIVPSARPKGGVGKMLQQFSQMQTQHFQQMQQQQMEMLARIFQQFDPDGGKRD